MKVVRRYEVPAADETCFAPVWLVGVPGPIAMGDYYRPPPCALAADLAAYLAGRKSRRIRGSRRIHRRGWNRPWRGGGIPNFRMRIVRGLRLVPLDKVASSYSDEANILRVLRRCDIPAGFVKNPLSPPGLNSPSLFPCRARTA